jgi:hypothetical protein
MTPISLNESRTKQCSSGSELLKGKQIQVVVEEVLQKTLFIDVHTHLFAPEMGGIGLWGIDELLTYHYLEAELFRSSRITPSEYQSLEKQAKADLVWRTLFVENCPISEAARGFIAVLKAFGLPTGGSSLKEARAFFAAQKLERHIEKVFALAGISEVVMTNDPLDPNEAPLWNRGFQRHPQFHAALRLDRIINSWPKHWNILASRGYRVDEHARGKTIAEVRRFLRDWCECMRPVEMAVSLPDTFQYPDQDVRTRLLREAVLPTCREFRIPMALMIGVRYQVNPAIGLAGDAVGRADLRALENICRDFPENRFLVSVLSRENQHELCVYARKFSNLMPFGCWWFLNNPSIVEEMTRERVEMLGLSFIPQHSDARVLEQVIYKWRNTRRTLAGILAERYQLMREDGREVTHRDIQSGVTRLFRSNFEECTCMRNGGRD